MGTELVEVYEGIKKSRKWDENKVNYLAGAYAIALKHIYGEQFVSVDLYENKVLYEKRQQNGITGLYEHEIF